MDPITALVIVVVSAFAAIVALTYFTYRFLRRTLVYIKSDTVYQAETVDPVDGKKEDDTEVLVDDDEGLEATMAAKQAAAYRENA